MWLVLILLIVFAIGYACEQSRTKKIYADEPTNTFQNNADRELEEIRQIHERLNQYRAITGDTYSWSDAVREYEREQRDRYY
ncbi:hypothetical protein [Enterobacter hormaechei]|uniref:hypothetical protein n=1 Tax=Enterobacter hormaechei TaxID=158836 RepID=UPI002B2431D4|nr:hypothetical protein [Enterobacter hormaechei]